MSVKALLRGAADTAYNRRFVRAVAGVTAEDVRRVARRYLPLFLDPKVREGKSNQQPDGTFQTHERNKFSFKRVVKHVIRIPHKCQIFLHHFVMLVSLKVPSGKETKRRFFWGIM